MVGKGIRRVCVIGAGTMGGGIAAHLANVGFEVTLLDASQASVQAGLERAKTARPPHFMVPETAARIRLGNVDDHLAWASEADWVCEAIIEDLEAKRALFERLEAVLPEDAMVTTNTSGLQIALLAEGRSPSFRRRFLGTHFFNPPRYLKLLELIPTPETEPRVVEEMARFMGGPAARRVVPAKDTPGFIANRFGMWAMFHAVHTAERLHLSVEQVDAITGTFLGRPRSASFRLNDLVGLDVMRDIARNLVERCPNDPHIAALKHPHSLDILLERGWLGEKSGRGYYRKEGKELLVLDLNTLAYRDLLPVELPSLAELAPLPLGERLSRALGQRDEVGEFLRNHLIPVLRYADAIQPEVSHSVLDFDRVMQWGFGWQVGPFAMMDAIGHDLFGVTAEPFYRPSEQRRADGVYVSIPAEPEYRVLGDYPVVDEGHHLRLRDMGDGVTAICLMTKMGTFTPAVVEEIHERLDAGLDRFVLTSEARSFSVGFDLGYFLSAIQDGRLEEVDAALARLQWLGERLEGVTAVAAVFGHCLGGGLEVAFSCPKVVAAAECQIGLPEARVGLLPAGRGTTLMRLRNAHNARRVCDVAMTLIEGVVATNADQARGLGYLRPTDVTCYHPDGLFETAKRELLAAEAVPRPVWRPIEGPLSGQIDSAIEDAKKKGRLTEFDLQIANHIRGVVAKSTDYADALYRERTAFLDLCRQAYSVARMRHMLENGKPLRN